MDRRYDYFSRSRHVSRHDERYFRPRYPSPLLRNNRYNTAPREHSHRPLTRHDVGKRAESSRIDKPTEEKREEGKVQVKPVVIKESVISFDSDGEEDWAKESLGKLTDQVKEPVKTEPKKSEDSVPEPWVSHKTEKGEVYYYNKITRESVWNLKDIVTEESRVAKKEEDRTEQGKESRLKQRKEIRLDKREEIRSEKKVTIRSEKREDIHSERREEIRSETRRSAFSNRYPSPPIRHFSNRYTPYEQRWPADRRMMRRNDPYDRRYR